MAIANQFFSVAAISSGLLLLVPDAYMLVNAGHHANLAYWLNALLQSWIAGLRAGAGIWSVAWPPSRMPDAAVSESE